MPEFVQECPAQFFAEASAAILRLVKNIFKEKEYLRGQERTFIAIPDRWPGE
jgi:hypothetical protein